MNYRTTPNINQFPDRKNLQHPLYSTILNSKSSHHHITKIAYGIISVSIKSVMNIEQINRRHFIETDMYYRVGYGLTSKLLKYKNGIMHIHVVIGKKWDKSYSATAMEMAQCWKKSYNELSKAVACKVFIVDTRKYNYKQYLIHRGMTPGYDAQKGIIFQKNILN